MSLHREQGPRGQPADRLRRPPEARIRRPGGACRRSARLEPGDPRRAGRRHGQGAEPARPRAKAGLDFFAKLNEAGNFVPVIGKAGTLAQGTTPDHHRVGLQRACRADTLAGNPPVEVVVPTSGVLAGVYVQAICAYAPHPNAAKLWMEYLYSDEGQLGWLKGYCHPIRFNDMVERRRGPAGTDRQAAAGRVLRGRLLPDAGRGERQRGRGQRRLGRGRRRQRLSNVY